MNPSVVISLVVYNGERYLKECLESIHAQTYRDYSLVIIDNASCDKTRDIIQHYAPGATHIFESQNTGFSRAHNRALRETVEDFIFILNQDCVLEPRYLEHCVHALANVQSLACVSGVLLRGTGCSDSRRANRSKRNGLTDEREHDIIDTLGLCVRRTFHIANLGSGLFASSIPHKMFQVFGVSATAALYRRQALEQTAWEKEGHKEYFDEDFFMYKEDVDLAFRLYQKGWNSLCEPRARGTHVRSTEQGLFSRSNSRVNELSYGNHLLFLVKNITPQIALKYGLFIAAYELMKFFYMLAREPTSLQAIVRAWKLRSRIMPKRHVVPRRFRPIHFGCDITTHAH